jgi:CheY-like chemotaxis protein
MADSDLAGGPRVLFVDDDERVLHGLRIWLRGRGWDMRFAAGGPEALQLMQDWTPDVVVTDMRMPEIDGAELLRRVRDLHPAALRVALSGYAQEELGRRAEALSHHWFDKPCERQRLIDTIETWAERKP